MDELLQKNNELLQKLIDRYDSPTHEAEHNYIRAVMVREEKKQKLWDAIIEKSVASLAWSFIVAVAVGLWTYLKDHWKWQ
jgi:hypothetical protein